MQTTRAWFSEVPWSTVVSINQSLCEAQKVPSQLGHRHDQARNFWESFGTKSLSVVEALEVCRKCNEMLPFTFNCGNTFAQLSKSLVEDWAQQLPSVEAHILRTTVTHFVNGQVLRPELLQVLNYLQATPRPKAASPSAVPPVATPVPSRQAVRV